MTGPQPWTEEELEALENADEWDWEHGELHPSVANPSTAFTVRFSREESRALYAAAREAGVNVLEYIRAAALTKARGGAQLPKS